MALDLPRLDEIALDGRILLYTTATSIAVAFLCGLFPAMRIARGDIASGLNEAGRTQVSARHSLQWVLVGAQVALSVTLLAAAGLLVRSFYELSRVDLGFETSRILTFRMSGSYAETNNYERLVQRIDGTLEALEALPGVGEAATATRLPGVPAEYESQFELVEGQRGANDRITAQSRFVSPGYFETMQIPLVAGAPCRRQPRNGTSDVIVNRAFVARYLAAWPSPISLHLSRESWLGRIVGVVGDTRERGLDRDPGPMVYTCFSAPNPFPHFLVRTEGDPLAMAQAVRLKMKEIEPLRSVYDIAPLEQRIGEAFTENRLRMVLLALFAATALALAAVGLYGTLSYVVSRRRREVGLRLALGALRSDIMKQFLGQGFRVSAAASACGLVLAIASTRVLSGMLYGVSPSDPLTLAGVVAIVLTVACLAALIPAARAALLQPMRVLREE